MTEDEIKQAILNECPIGHWPTYAEVLSAERAAYRIVTAFADELRSLADKPGSTPFYPARVCNCGAERTRPGLVHYSWCLLVRGPVQR